jgi:DNA modification methylase
VVWDPFGGLATVGVAALKLGRQYRGSEPNPLYYEAGLKRLKELTIHPVTATVSP